MIYSQGIFLKSEPFFVGDMYKDKESFVTSAYKKKLEEMKKLEEEEKREEYLEKIGDVRKQGNLDGFYRHLYDQKVNYDSKKAISIKHDVKDEPISDNENENEVTTENGKFLIKFESQTLSISTFRSQLFGGKKMY